MIRPLSVIPESLPPAPAPLVAVDRACGEIRRGGIVVLREKIGGSWALVLATEAATEDSLARLASLAGSEAALVVTTRRVRALGQEPPAAEAALLEDPRGLSVSELLAVADPCADLPVPAGLHFVAAVPGGAAEAAMRLAKIARLLPSAFVAPCEGDAAAFARRHHLLCVTADEIAVHTAMAAESLRLVGEARVPLVESENTRILAFRPSDGGVEHLAIVIGEPDLDRPVLTRLHSECFTGDLLGSLRCDCGDQLRGAIAEISQAGSGILLYLAQEGRGIGLVNKLRAYRLQDAGFDTLDANGQLGFDDDERVYLPAARMLRLLGVEQVRLLTNNPLKVQALARHGIAVSERVPHVFPANGHNEHYLRTKATRSGHLF
ncbi:GTP cyclohydrolase II [Telmatospirillum sp. J64-1]|uniref:GTP cyclohydrolase II n=1 Tax=Telmatospirillum sp. J64-1 TaxID=2502183 RepID=UPI00115CF3EF|nr:GTP cyclohydrolase II [Telmatospirillum sp. J64-1]